MGKKRSRVFVLTRVRVFFRLQQTCLKLPNFLYAFVAVLCLCIAEFCFLHPPAALAHSLSCQRHSGLEAGKQAEELRTDSISLKVCVCRGPEWCWGTPVQSIVWIAPRWNFDFDSSRTLTTLCQFASSESRISLDPRLSPLSLPSSLPSFVSSLSGSPRLCFGFNLKATLLGWCGLMD